MAIAANTSTDETDATVRRWSRQRPDLDVSPLALSGRLSRASRVVDRSLNAVLTEYGLQGWEFDVLATLRTDGEPYEMCPGTIGDHLGVSNSAMTNRVNRLEQAGLVERHFSPHNRRIIIVRLTEEGRTITDRAMSSYLAAAERSFAGLTAEESALLRTLLGKVGETTPAEEG